MRISAAVHIESQDSLTVDGLDERAWIEVVDRDGDRLPIHARSPEIFEALAEAASLAAQRMRLARAARPFDLGAELEAAG